MAGTEENPIVYPPLEMPANVQRGQVTVWSLGLALDADIYRPTDRAPDAKLPAVVLSHGMGGDKLTCERYAAKFASVGIVAMAFSQSSWGDSHGRLMLVDGSAPDDSGEMTARVRMAREVIDPLDWIDGYRAMVDYLEGDSMVNPQRLGAWGTSFGGGTALCVAATDARIKALAIQVPAVFNPPAPMLELGSLRARQIARGEVDSFDLDGDGMPGVPGKVHYARMAQYRVGDLVERVTVPALILDAANEELFDITQSGGRAHELIKARGVESYYEVLPDIDHYGIYFGGYERGSELAKDWFLKYL